MITPTLCMVYDAIASGHGSIPQLALAQVRRALDANWKVTCLCRDLEADLRGEVEHLPLHVPGHVFTYQWLSARRNIQAALGEREFDVLHVHQAQVAALADVMQCHFLTRAAWQSGGVAPGSGLRGKYNTAQLRVVMGAEDRYFKSLATTPKSSAKTNVVFCSELLQREFTRLYGAPPRAQVIVNPCPPANFPSDEERQTARRKWVGDTRRLVVGYLGGIDERKGYKPLLEAIEADDELFLLLGGEKTGGFEVPALKGRLTATGKISDIRDFISACDVFVVPSSFDPCPLMTFEAAAFGAPVIATRGVGNLPDIVRFSAGREWESKASLGDLARSMTPKRAQSNQGARQMCAELGENQHAARVFALYEDIRERKRAANKRAKTG